MHGIIVRDGRTDAPYYFVRMNAIRARAGKTADNERTQFTGGAVKILSAENTQPDRRTYRGGSTDQVRRVAVITRYTTDVSRPNTPRGPNPSAGPVTTGDQNERKTRVCGTDDDIPERYSAVGGGGGGKRDDFPRREHFGRRAA